MPLQIKRLHPEAQIPKRATPQSIGLDLYANLISETGRANNCLIPPRASRLIPTGLLVVPPPGFAVFVCSRSGMAKDHSLFVTNAPGLVDPDYRGELCVLLYNGSHESHWIRHGDRVGQIILLPCIPHQVEEVVMVDMDTARGTSGFGSTGR